MDGKFKRKFTYPGTKPTKQDHTRFWHIDGKFVSVGHLACLRSHAAPIVRGYFLNFRKIFPMNEWLNDAAYNVMLCLPDNEHFIEKA
jgi:hypothetical protein